MVRNPPKPKASEKKKWQSKPPTKAQLDKIIEESKNIAALETQRAIAAIQIQSEEVLDPNAQIPNNPASIFASTPAKTNTNS